MECGFFVRDEDMQANEIGVELQSDSEAKRVSMVVGRTVMAGYVIPFEDLPKTIHAFDEAAVYGSVVDNLFKELIIHQYQR